MKHLLTLIAILISTLTTAQTTVEFPWNPDADGDDFIGVNDLMALLGEYGSVFSEESLYVSESGVIASFYTGEKKYLECLESCSQLPGRWVMPNLTQFGRIVSALEAQSVDNAWVHAGGSREVTLQSGSSEQYGLLVRSQDLGVKQEPMKYAFGCFCYTSERPKVEYDYCAQAGGNYIEALQNLKPCVDQKLSEGWQLSGPTQNGAREDIYLQSFWRYAE